MSVSILVYIESEIKNILTANMIQAPTNQNELWPYITHTVWLKLVLGCIPLGVFPLIDMLYVF